MKIPYIVIITPFLTFASGMTLFPFILLQRKSYKWDKELINHERIHIQQQVEMLILPFYVLYFINYLFNLIKYRNHDDAYMNMYFEREAYANEHDLEYLENRKAWSFLGYLRK